MKKANRIMSVVLLFVCIITYVPSLSAEECENCDKYKEGNTTVYEDSQGEYFIPDNETSGNTKSPGSKDYGVVARAFGLKMSLVKAYDDGKAIDEPIIHSSIYFVKNLVDNNSMSGKRFYGYAGDGSNYGIYAAYRNWDNSPYDRKKYARIGSICGFTVGKKTDYNCIQTYSGASFRTADVGGFGYSGEITPDYLIAYDTDKYDEVGKQEVWPMAANLNDPLNFNNLFVAADGYFIDNGKVSEWLRTETNGSATWENLYWVLWKLDACSILGCTQSWNWQGLKDRIQEIAVEGNKPLRNYILVVEPIFDTSFNRSGDWKYYYYSTMKGLAAYMVNLIDSEQSQIRFNYNPGKANTLKEYRDGLFAIGQYKNNFIHLMYITRNHGFYKGIDSNPIANDGNLGLSRDEWAIIADPSTGYGYNIWEFDSIFGYMGCQIVNNNYYCDENEDGKVDENDHCDLEKWKEQCTHYKCEKVDINNDEIYDYKDTYYCTHEVLVEGTSITTYEKCEGGKEQWEEECLEPTDVCTTKDNNSDGTPDQYFCLDDEDGDGKTDACTEQEFYNVCSCHVDNSKNPAEYYCPDDSYKSDDDSLPDVCQKSQYDVVCGCHKDDTDPDNVKYYCPDDSYNSDDDTLPDECNPMQYAQKCLNEDPKACTPSKTGGYYCPDKDGNPYECPEDEYNRVCGCHIDDSDPDNVQHYCPDDPDDDDTLPEECDEPEYFEKCLPQKDRICKAVTDESGNETFYGADGKIITASNPLAIFISDCCGTLPQEEFEKYCPEPPKTCTPEVETTNVSATCSNKDDDGTIEDAPMCSILASNDKNDYKLNNAASNEYCDVYCRESYNFNFMEHAETYAGQGFKHELTSSHGLGNHYSALINVTVECTSEIKYDEWENAIIKANIDVVNAWNDWKRWEALAASTPVIEGSWDQRDCDNTWYGTDYWKYTWSASGYPQCSVDEYGVTSCTNNSYDSQYTGGNNPAYCYHSWEGTNCRGYSKTSSINPSNGEYNCYTEGKKMSDSCPSDGDLVCSEDPVDKTKVTCRCLSENKKANCTDHCSGGKPAVSSYASGMASQMKTNYNNEVIARDKLLKQIKDCEFFDGSQMYNQITNARIDAATDSVAITGLDYAAKDEKAYVKNLTKSVSNPYDISRTYASSNDWAVYCGDECASEISDTNDASSKLVANIICNDSGCSNNPETVYSANIATIKVSKEVGFRQETKFYTQMFSGDVTSVPPSEGGYLEMPDYSWPTSLNLESRTNYPGNHNNLDYPIRFDYTVGSTKRISNKVKDGTYSCAVSIINLFTQFTCTTPNHPVICFQCGENGVPCPDPDDPNYKGIGLTFRTIDLANVFPSVDLSDIDKITSDDPYDPSVPMGWNWRNTNAIDVINAIQNNSNILTSNTKPRYRITLTPETMKDIRSYNSGTDYLDMSLDCQNTLRCTSNFIKGGYINIKDRPKIEVNSYDKEELHYYHE